MNKFTRAMPIQLMISLFMCLFFLFSCKSEKSRKQIIQGNALDSVVIKSQYPPNVIIKLTRTSVRAEGESENYIYFDRNSYWICTTSVLENPFEMKEKVKHSRNVSHKRKRNAQDFYYNVVEIYCDSITSEAKYSEKLTANRCGILSVQEYKNGKYKEYHVDPKLLYKELSKLPMDTFASKSINLFFLSAIENQEKYFRGCM